MNPLKKTALLVGVILLTCSPCAHADFFIDDFTQQTLNFTSSNLLNQTGITATNTIGTVRTTNYFQNGGAAGDVIISSGSFNFNSGSNNDIVTLLYNGASNGTNGTAITSIPVVPSSFGLTGANFTLNHLVQFDVTTSTGFGDKLKLTLWTDASNWAEWDITVTNNGIATIDVTGTTPTNSAGSVNLNAVGAVTVSLNQPAGPSNQSIDFSFIEAVQPVGVPEPASLALLGAVSLGAAGYGWRQRRKKVAEAQPTAVSA
jgi:hypothetical protein